MGGKITGNTDPSTLADLRYQTLGTSPNRVFVVQWSRMRYYSTVGDLNFQVRLHEGSNVIDFVYGTATATTTANGTVAAAQVGLRGYTPNDWNNRAGTWPTSTAGAANTAALPLNPTNAPASGLTYTFTPPAPQPCPQPFSLTAAPAGTQARLNWRALAPNAGPYTVVWGLAGFNPAGGGLGTRSVAGTSTTITSLTPTTDYDFYVTQNCGGTAGTSPVSNPAGHFRTTILNDEPADATPLPLTATCQPVGSTTTGATRTTGNGYDPFLDCNGSSGTRAEADVWFTFTTAATGLASTSVQLTGAGAAAVAVRVFRSAAGAAGPFTQIYCYNPISSFIPTFPSFILTQLTPSTTYYIMVFNGQYGGPTGPFTLCATVPPACGDPTSAFSNILNSTATTAQLTFSPGGGALNYNVTLTPSGGTPFVVMPLPTASPAILANLTPATTYAGTLQANCGNGGVSAAVPFTAYTRPSNDNITAAVALSIGATCQPITGNTDNSSVSASQLGFPSSGFPVGCGSTRPYDVWYTFITPTTGPASQAVRIVVTGTGAGQVRVFVRTGTTYTQVGCSAAPTGAAPLLDLVQLTPNTTYYVGIGNYGAAIYPGQFTVCVTEPPSCGAPLSLGITSITATSANLSFLAGTPAPAGTTYTVGVAAVGAAPTTFTNSGASGLIPLTALLPGTYYTVTLQANCGGAAGLSQPARISFRTLGPPANDLCANAVNINCASGRLTADLTGATAAGQPTTACGGVPPLGPSLWYHLVGTGDEVTVSFCSGFADDPDMQLLVYGGSCANLTCVGSNDNSIGCLARLPALTFATTAGQDYYVLAVDTQRPLVPVTQVSSGQFDLVMRCTAPAAACPPPVGVAVQVGGPTTATVTWTPVSGVSGYQVIWQPLNLNVPLPSPPPPIYSVAGNLGTQTATGLLPNTAYAVSVTILCSGGTGSAQPRSRPATAAFSTVLAARPAAADAVELFPNPARTTATLRLPAAWRSAALAGQLCDALGRPVRQLAWPAGGPEALTLDLRGLPAGAYWLRLVAPQGVVLKRLVVE